MRFHIDTDFLVCPDTYGTGIRDRVREDCWEDAKQIMASQAKKFLARYLRHTDFANAKFELEELRSPGDYSRGSDWFNMTLDFDDSLLEQIKSKVNDEFFSWIMETYHSSCGWVSYYPLTREAWFAAIDEPYHEFSWRFSNKELAVIEYITWQIKSKFDLQKIQYDYIAACWSDIMESGYECDDEEEESA